MSALDNGSAAARSRPARHDRGAWTRRFASRVPARTVVLSLFFVALLAAGPAAAHAAPSVAITAPAATTTVKGTVPVTAQATAEPGRTMSSISFYDGVQSIGSASCQSQTNCTATISWRATGLSGPHTLTARAFDSSSAQTTSAGVTVTVESPPPTVSIVTPASGASVKGTVVITASGATDPALTDYPRSISFYDGVNSIGSISCQGQTTCSGSVNWPATGLTGPHTLTARITTDDGEQSTSAPVEVTAVTPAPTVTITRPKSGAGFSGGSMLLAASAATDPALSDYPTSVSFYDGTNSIGSFSCQGQTTCSGSVRWTTTGLKGTHSITAVVRTDRGATATSARVSVGRKPRKKAKVTCKLSKTRIRAGKSARGNCSIAGASKGTAVAVAYRSGGSLKTFARTKTGSGGRFHFSVKGPRGTYRLVVIVSANSRYLRTTTSIGTLRIG